MIVEQFVDGDRDERDGGRSGRRRHAADALRPPAAAGRGLRRRLDPRVPGCARRSDGPAEAEALVDRTVHALGLRNGIAFPQLIAATDGSIQVIEVAARIPGGQMADLVQHAVGVDLVEVALRFALGEPVTDEIAAPKKRQPVAIRFFTAEPGPLPAGQGQGTGRPRQGAHGAGCRAGGELHRRRRDDPPRQGRRRPARLRDRRRFDGAGGARARGAGGHVSSRSRSSE